MSDKAYETVIGLEVHLQIATKTKAFCGCINEFGREPNTSVCPVCLGLPGSLPVLNKRYLVYAIKVARAFHCRVSAIMKFDRKNYFYPDLPKNYQISQYDMPLSSKGFLEIFLPEGAKRIGIRRVHMEEDAGKLIHDARRPFSFVDYNRSGTPLLEIVSEPDIASAEEAYLYLVSLKGIIEYLDVSDCDMEKGSLRCDANISVRPRGDKALGVKVEVKNMNTFKGARMALEYEQARQIRLLSDGNAIVQETRLWNTEKKVTVPMRSKEEAHDYRYFPEPDLVPFSIDEALVDEIAKTIPELPHDRRTRFVKDYKLSEYDASVLVSDRAMADFFESSVRECGHDKAKVIANWIMGDILKFSNANDIGFRVLQQRMSPRSMVEMLRLIDEQVISGSVAKGVLQEMLNTGRTAPEIVKQKGLTQISDREEIAAMVEKVVSAHQDVVADYAKGKEKALQFLVGELMKLSKGKVNPHLGNDIIKKRLDKGA